ncbi:hypothetical protein TNIN_214181 [Trichonephila inaurata madagascariensis]|uniref:Uncharacterized protein n=1 Tax=Trichonephila inaurata madagascariensis TaxID=2747483 RepID=A0A8X7CGP6_9ARAC|nr:hypothetical protein TNIN_214181 [Trichonephila inaurata madagascariensis]
MNTYQFQIFAVIFAVLLVYSYAEEEVEKKPEIQGRHLLGGLGLGHHAGIGLGGHAGLGPWRLMDMADTAMVVTGRANTGKDPITVKQGQEVELYKSGSLRTWYVESWWIWTWRIWPRRVWTRLWMRRWRNP